MKRITEFFVVLYYSGMLLLYFDRVKREVVYVGTS